MKTSSKNRFVKYLFDIVIIVLCVFCFSELYHYELFFGKPFCPEVPVSDVSLDEEGLEQLCKTVKQYDVDILLYFQADSKELVKDYYFGSEEAWNRYCRWTGIREGEYGSIIGNRIKIKYEPMNHLGEYDGFETGEVLFVSEKNARKIIPANVVLGLGLKDIYGRNEQPGTMAKSYAWLFMGGMIVVLILFEGYQALYESKQYMLRCLMGHDAWRLSAGKIIWDALILGISFAGAYFATGRIYGEKSELLIPALVFGAVFLAADLILCYFIFAKNWRKAFTRGNNSAVLSTASLGIRFFVLIILTAVTTLNFQVIRLYRDATSHSDFYQYFDGWYTIGSNFDYMNECYLDLLESGRVALFRSDKDEKERTYIQINRKAHQYLEECFGFSEKGPEDEIIIYYPDSVSEPIEVKQELYLFEDERCNVRFQSYSKDVILPDNRRSGFDPDLMNWEKSPIIVADFRDRIPAVEEVVSNGVFWIYYDSYLVDPNGIGEEKDGKLTIRTERGGQFKLNSLSESYEDSIRPFKRLAIAALFFIGVFGIMEFVLTIRIILLDFQTNAMKYITKRLLGASFLNVYGGLLMSAAFLCTTGVLASRIILKDEFSWPIAVCVGLGIFLLEEAVRVICIIRLENTNFPKIIKGGTL